MDTATVVRLATALVVSLVVLAALARGLGYLSKGHEEKVPRLLGVGIMLVAFSVLGVAGVSFVLTGIFMGIQVTPPPTP